VDIPKPKNAKNTPNIKAMVRRIQIIQRIELGEVMTTKSLGIDFSVTQRVIQEDIKNVLRHFGITTNDNHELILNAPIPYKKTSLYEEERQTLALGLSQVEDIDQEYSDRVKRIAKKTYVENVETPFFIKAETFEPFHNKRELVKDLKRAIKNHLKIEIFFEGKSIELFPYKIASFEGIWYLLADGIEDDSIRNYMISHVEDYFITNERFEPITNLEEILETMESEWFVEGTSFEVIVKVYPEIAEYFNLKKHLDSQELLETYPDGSLKISFDVSHDEDIDNLIKSWLPHIEVLSPLRFRERIRNELIQYLEKTKI